MVPAAVGFQCRECVAQGQARIEHTRGVSLVPRGGDKPYVTYAIVGICAAVYLIQFLVGDIIIQKYAMQPVAISVYDEWYRLATSMFLHGSIFHILFNMYVLIVLGPTLERILGHGKFLLLYLIAGLGGAALSYALNSPMTFSVGASGAIFGIMGALVVAGKRLGFDITMVLVLIGINLIIGFVFGGSIDWRAHIGGLLSGAAMAWALTQNGPQARNRSIVAVVLVVLAIVAVVGYRSAQLRGYL